MPAAGAPSPRAAARQMARISVASASQTMGIRIRSIGVGFVMS